MKSGEVVLVKFPFSDLETIKKRPALVLRQVKLHKQSIVVIAMITSRVEGIKLAGDVILTDWKSASLLHPSLVRLAKIATIDSLLIEKQLGAVTKKDFSVLSKSFRELFSDWL
jgi:mRNA interferase MazF